MTNQPMSPLNGTKTTNRLLIFLAALSILLTLGVFWSYLWDKYLVVRDLQNFYWMALNQDATLFPIDYLMKDQMLQFTILGSPMVLHPASLGHSFIFFAVSPWIDHIWFSKWLVIILMPLCVIYLFKTGQFLENDLTAASLSLLFIFFMLASYQSISVASGLQRAFAIPLLIIFFYYVLREQYVWVAILIVVSALFYWPNVPLMVVAWGLSFVRFSTPLKPSLRLNSVKLVSLLVSLFLSLLILLPELLLRFDALRPQDVPTTQDPGFQSGGATPLFINFPWMGRAGIFDAGTDLINFVVLLILGVLIYQVVGRESFRRLPKAYWHLLAAALIMYAASFVVLVGLSSALLYQPSRYTRSTFFFLALLYVGLNWRDFLERSPSWFRKKAPLLMVISIAILLAIGITFFLPTRILLMPILWMAGVIFSGVAVVFATSGLYWLVTGKSGKVIQMAAVLMLSVITLVAGIYFIKTLGIRTIDPSEGQRDVYEFVSTLPKDTILAGNPVIMAGIPLFSKRSVLFRDLHPNVNPNVSEFILDYFDAQYTDDPEAALSFCERYGVDYLVLDTTEFEQDYLKKGEFFYSPWNEKIIEIVTGRSDFILPRLRPVFQSAPYFVVKCDANTLLVNSK